MSEQLLLESVILVAATACVVAFCVRIGLSPIVGYLAVGIAIGPNGLGLLAMTEGTRFFAELGIVFLMFLVGLEFSLPRMIAASSAVFGAGGLQVGITVLVVTGLAIWFGVDPLAAVLLGGAIAMSSTAISLKQLSDIGELNSLHGRLAFGILLFQDLATLPFLVLIGALSTGADARLVDVVGRIGLAIAAFLFVATLGRPLLTRFIAWIAARRSAELFLLAVLAVVLGTAFLAGEIGLSLPLGAFLAGMIIGESDFHHQVADDIRPFRDVLLGLFFLTVGMQIDPAAVLASPVWLVSALLVFLLAKPIIVYLIALVTHRHREPGLRTAIILAHGGEFGLLILTQGLSANLIDAQVAQPLLSALVLSMALAPVMIQYNQRLANLVGRFGVPQYAGSAAERVADASRDLSDHVILCGCGRIGRLVATVLEGSSVPYVSIESDYGQVQQARHHGHFVVFGDASRRQILEAAGLRKAKLIVVTFDQRHSVKKILHHIRHVAPSVLVVVSTEEDKDLEELAAAGASLILPENLAAGLALSAQVLLIFGLDHSDVEQRINEVRAALNPELFDTLNE